MVRSLRLYGNTFVYHDSFQAMNGTRLNSLCSAVRMSSVLVVLSALLFLGGGGVFNIYASNFFSIQIL